jgi:hypothetical protein
MLRDDKTGLFYRRGQHNWSKNRWVEQERASVWTNKQGPAAARQYHKNPTTVVHFELKEIDEPA